jgi:hypothetical protein
MPLQDFFGGICIAASHSVSKATRVKNLPVCVEPRYFQGGCRFGMNRWGIVSLKIDVVI